MHTSPCAWRPAGRAATAAAWLVAAASAALPAASLAQVVREDGVKSIAGVLSTLPSGASSAEWTFRSAGGEVLFASIDGDIYKAATEHTSRLAGMLPAAAEHEDDGGPGLFRLRVLDGYGQTVCVAERPAPPPGWQRDPRMACVLAALAGQSAPATYRLRVELIRSSDHAMAPQYPFLLNLSLRRIARSGTSVQAAIATSNAAPF